MPREFKTVVHRNSDSRLSQEILASVAKQRDVKIARDRKIFELSSLLEATPEEIATQKMLLQNHHRNLGIEASQIAALQADRKRRNLEVLSEWSKLPTPSARPAFRDNTPVQLDGTGAMQMWWAESHGWTDDTGLTAFADNTTSSIAWAGEVSDPQKSYKQRKISVTATFVLSADRIPADFIGVGVLSVPVVTLAGAVRAMASADLFSFGPQYARCSLSVNQSIAIQTPVAKGQWLPLVSSSAPDLSLISVGNYDAQFNTFPGDYSMPPCKFGIDSGWDVQSTLNFLFNIEMDGDDSDMIFGKDPAYQNDTILTPQWYITKL